MCPSNLLLLKRPAEKQHDNPYLMRTQFFLDNRFLIHIVQTVVFDVAAPVAKFLILVITTTITILKLKLLKDYLFSCLVDIRNRICTPLRVFKIC